MVIGKRPIILDRGESRLLLEGFILDRDMAKFVASFNERGLGGNLGSIYAERSGEGSLLAKITFPVTRSGFFAQDKARNVLNSFGVVKE